jgi:hypothetical protein
MGYTHYWDQKAEPEYMQWLAITEHLKHIIEQAIEDGSMCIQYESDDDAPVLITNDLIRFNGIGDEAHETFGLSRIDVGEFDFCKTANKPYDKFVVYVLILAHNLAPGCYIITSDGDASDWQEYLNQLNRICATAYTLPETI